MKSLRLIFPQWQGAESEIISNYVVELPANEAAQGYYLGSQLLSWLAPPSSTPSEVVPVSLDYEDTATENGIFAYRVVNKQLDKALEILNRHSPERVLTLGGECSTSVAPFTYLTKRYSGDIAVVWIDAHPDLSLPNEGYTGFHAMALAAILGKGDKGILEKLPSSLDSRFTLLVGMHGTSDPQDKVRPEKYGVKVVSASVANRQGPEVLDWLRQTGKSKVLVHLDLDSIDPRDLHIAVTSDLDGVRLDTVISLINSIAGNFDLVGLTVAEPIPREVIKLRRLLTSLPLF